MTALEFLEKLWREKPDDQYILIWTLQDKRSRWFRSVPAAAEYVASINGNRDIYVGVGLAGKDYGASNRCASDAITGLAGMWSDLDICSEAHAKAALPASIEEALSIVPAHMPPTIIIATGNGLHCWWLFKEPLIFDTPEERTHAARVAARWHTYIQECAARRGWAYERLSDLARVLRVPATHNLKDPANRKDVVVHSTSERYYNLRDFEEFLDGNGVADPEEEERAAREWTARFAEAPIVINPSARIPDETLTSWMETDLRFRATWNRQRYDLRDQTNSGYDMALADFGALAELSPQLIVDLICHHRAIHGKAQRLKVSYFQRTISKAIDHAAELKAANRGSVEAPSPADETPEQRRTRLCREISERFGVQIIKILNIKGKDPCYHVHTEQGVIEIESISQFLSYRFWYEAIAAKLKKTICREKSMKPKEWSGGFTQKLLDASEDVECTEEEEFEASVISNLYDYLTETDFIDRIAGHRVSDQKRPMIVEGRIQVCSSHFYHYLKRSKMLDVKSPRGTASMLAAIGAKKAGRRRGKGIESQERWELPIETFDPTVIRKIEEHE